MSQDWKDDDALDSALGRLGNPSGASPMASGSALLARAAGTAPRKPTPAPTVGGSLRQGLQGARLAAALALAVGAGFIGGLSMRGLQPVVEAPTARVATTEPEAAGARVVGPVARSSATAEAPPAPTDGRTPPASAERGNASEGSRRRHVARRTARNQHHGGETARRGTARETTEPSPTPPSIAPDTDVLIAETASDGDGPPFRGPMQAPERPTAPTPPPASESEPARASRGRVTVGLGGAVATASPDAPPDLPPDGRVPDPNGTDPHPPRTATSALVTASYTRVVRDSPRAPWWSVGGGLGRTRFAVRADESEHAHPTWSADVGGGVSWTRRGARLDTGLTLGALGFLDTTRERSGEPEAHEEGARERVPDIARVPMLTVGTRASLALGQESRPRLHLDLAPRLALAKGRAPSPSLNVSIGGEFGIGRRAR
jgi:hypothetical protein